MMSVYGHENSLFRTRPLVQIKDLVNWKIVTDKIRNRKEYQALFEQHYTTSTKLFIALRHFNRLGKMVPNQKITDLMEIEINEQNDFVAKWTKSFLEISEDYLGELDGFFFSLRSCIDSFLWELNYVFKLECKRAGYVKDVMNKKYGKKEINRLLNDLYEEEWFKYLGYMRNNLAHYSLTEIAAFTEDFKLYLPKNPETSYYSREKEFEVMPLLKDLLQNTKRFLEQGYSLLIDELTF